MTKRAIEPIENGRIRLRLLQESDLPLTLMWRNEEHIRRWFFSSERILLEQHQGWFAQYQERDDDFVFVVEEMQNSNRPIGQAALYNVDWARQRAEFGRLLIGEPDATGKGFAHAATGLLIRFGFDQLGLEELYVQVYSDNTPALAIYTACGFQAVNQNARVITMTKQRA